MIDEDALRSLLREAADGAPAPGRAPDELLEAIAESSTPAPRRRPRGRAVLAAAAVLLVLVVGAAAFLDRSEPGPTSQESATSDAAARYQDERGETSAPTTTTFPPAAGSGGASDLDTTPGATGGASASAGQPAPAPAAPPPPAVATDTARVIKTGSLDIEVPARRFATTLERITSMALGLGGYVAESTTTESEDVPRGTITLRVPSSSFDQLVLEVRTLGDVKAVTSKGTDVTAQFTDLGARLSALSATRDRLFEVLRGARNVGDIIAVQDRITGVQTEIEQIQGQQRLLEDQTSFGTLAITLGEPGAEQVELVTEPNDGLGAAWDDARRRFGDSIEGLISWSGSASVVLLVGLVVAVLGRLAWVRGRRLLV